MQPANPRTRLGVPCTDRRDGPGSTGWDRAFSSGRVAARTCSLTGAPGAADHGRTMITSEFLLVKRSVVCVLVSCRRTDSQPQRFVPHRESFRHRGARRERPARGCSAEKRVRFGGELDPRRIRIQECRRKSQRVGLAVQLDLAAARALPNTEAGIERAIGYLGLATLSSAARVSA